MDWEVTIVTDSNYIKKVRVSDCVTRLDAEAQALGSTGAKRVIVSNPINTYNNLPVSSDSKVVDKNRIVNYTNNSEQLYYDESKPNPEVFFLLLMFLICSILWVASPVLSCIVGALSIWFVIWCNK